MSDYIDINVVVDRSGSMSSIKDQTESGFLEFIQQQIASDVKAKVSLYQFDHEYEEVFSGVDLEYVKTKNWVLEPRGSTALYDAVGRSINSTFLRVKKLKEDEKPKGVIFLIMTDGWENASKEYTSEKVKELIERQKKEDNWEFIYIGADQDAITAGSNMGIDMGRSANFTRGSTQDSYSLIGSKVAMYACAGDMVSGSALLNFSDSDRTEMTSK